MKTLPRRTGPRACPPARGTHLFALLLAVLLAGAPPARAEPPAPPPDLVRPVPGQVVRAFDGPAQRWSTGHRGADLAAPVGTPVLAAADGRVVFAGHVVDRDVLSLEHAGGWRTTYEPVHAVVRPGATVHVGDLVGYVEAGDECPAGCLHWGLRQGKDYLDPIAFLAAVGVRLLPAGASPAPASAPAVPTALLPLLQRPADPLPAASSGLARPSSAPITSPFGMRLHPVLHVWKLHDGTDFGAPCGAPAHSAAAGRVVLVERNLAYGNRVIVDHGVVGGRRLRTSYNHLQSVQVSLGQTVRQGQPVGAVGSTGYSTGCHLHFMVWSDGQVANPMGFLP